MGAEKLQKLVESGEFEKMSQEEKTNVLVAHLAEDLKPEVERIEASLSTTQFHYGEYMCLLGKCLQQYGRKWAMATAVALVEAGANRQGVGWAARILGLA